MTQLLDVNALVALAWPNHVHHVAALRWLSERDDQWATTPMTETGFVRVSSGPALRSAVKPSLALTQLERMRSHSRHTFLVDDVEGVVGDANTLHDRSSADVSDLHLLAVAQRHGAVLATFDRKLAALVPHEDSIVLIGDRGTIET